MSSLYRYNTLYFAFTFTVKAWAENNTAGFILTDISNWIAAFGDDRPIQSFHVWRIKQIPFSLYGKGVLSSVLSMFRDAEISERGHLVSLMLPSRIGEKIIEIPNQEFFFHEGVLMFPEEYYAR